MPTSLSKLFPEEDLLEMMLRSAGDAAVDGFSCSSSLPASRSSDISCRFARGVGVQIGALSARRTPSLSVPRPGPLGFELGVAGRPGPPGAL